MGIELFKERPIINEKDCLDDIEGTLCVQFLKHKANELFVVNDKNQLVGTIDIISFKNAEYARYYSLLNMDFDYVVWRKNSKELEKEVENYYKKKNKVLPVIDENGVLREIYRFVSDKNSIASYLTELRDLIKFILEDNRLEKYLKISSIRKVYFIGKDPFYNLILNKLKTSSIETEIIAEYNKSIVCKDVIFLEADEISFYIHRRYDERVSMLYKFVHDVWIFYDMIYFLKESRDKGITVIYAERPIISNHIGITENEKKRLEGEYFIQDMLNNSNDYLKQLRNIYPEEYTESDYKQLNYIPQLTYNSIRYSYMDYKSHFYEFSEGIRNTTDCPEKFQNIIYLFGKCLVMGYFVEDKYTIPSYLQRKVNSELPNKYKVENHGIWGIPKFGIWRNLRQESFKTGDVVIFFTHLFSENEIEVFEQYGLVCAKNIFTSSTEHKETIIDAASHLSFWGNEQLANFIFEIIKKRKTECTSLNICKEKVHLSNKVARINKEINEYLNYLKEETSVSGNQQNGAIVMNCNPFTLGHQKLIEYASQKVDQLFILVLSEDKSYFAFEQRYKMVCEGVKHLKNVKVLESGKVCISNLTFPEYFQKETKADSVIDASMDIDIFGKYIAPFLKIKTRFVGTESNDNITKQYNQKLHKLLGKYDIKVEEIERFSFGEEYISAKRVRQLILQRRWKDIQDIVPQSTYDIILKENY